MDRDSNNNCHWNAKIRHGRSCCLCTEVVAPILFSRWYMSVAAHSLPMPILMCIVCELLWSCYLDTQWSGGQIWTKACPSKVRIWFFLHTFDLRYSWSLNLFSESQFCLLLIFLIYNMIFVVYLVLNRTPDEVLAAKGVKPTLSPNLNTLALVEVPGIFFH